MNLSNLQKRYLRGLTHGLSPVIHVGKQGVTDALINEFDLALDHHELVKVKLIAEDRDIRETQRDQLGQRTKATLIHQIGKIVCYFRRNTDDPKLALPN